mmetsp:Transcript_106517/g.159349  ORF Transcript_106517/g.159349 Transcript_106517/m.159349 type:complete len:369 (-) Transcript_106517:125-1231(-)|eukprot:CAMPEP_0117006856 /NCGR_PEP_ID=MMETSP0472-20121206/6943_1 /TAXON_ID=693140 ORGANISM="Tiarina fusus, Strain LIS" /NCGR_SAMPLE_ID=MMETSP0472 /ASSEMBLY_ACC=CAM_ASM_000603 /LENGTH=368 /DNA_ID=CAMNT_0004708457 /DNA_START=50 /DNA_END=1156 /DNA_ORIENTATION=-
MSETQEPPASKGKVLHDLGPYDVLLGRGTGPNENQGNVRFREILKDTMGKYTRPGYAMSKAQIAREVLDQVQARNGNFVRKLGKGESGVIPSPSEPYNSRSKNFLYVIVPDSVAIEKTKQSIRFQIKAARKESKYDDAPHGSSSVAATLQEKPTHLTGAPSTAGVLNLSPAASKVALYASQMPGATRASSIADLVAWPTLGSQGSSVSTAAGLLKFQESGGGRLGASFVSNRIHDALAIQSHLAKQEVFERELAQHQALEQYYAQRILLQNQHHQQQQVQEAVAASLLGGASHAAQRLLPTDGFISSLSRRNGHLPTTSSIENLLRRSQSTGVAAPPAIRGGLTDPTLLALHAATNQRDHNGSSQQDL